VFSLNFLGERLEAGEVRAIALGGDFQILGDSTEVLGANPAATALCPKVTLGGSQWVGVYWSKSDQFREKDVDVKYPAFAAAFPLHRGLVLSLGYRARYDPDASFTNEKVDAAGETYRETFATSGGLYSVPLALGVRPFRYLALGASFDLERGSLEDSWQISFPGAQASPGGGSQRVEVSGTGFTVGALLFPGPGLVLSAFYDSRVEYELAVSETYTQSSLDTLYSGRAELPPRVGGALAWRVSDTWSLHLGGFRRDFQGIGGWGFDPGQLGVEEGYALGVAHRLGGGKDLRLSLSVGKLPYRYPPGQDIWEYALGLGTGFEIAHGSGRIDLALRAGKRGSLADNRLEERYLKLFVGVTGGEVWKRKRVRR